MKEYKGRNPQGSGAVAAPLLNGPDACDTAQEGGIIL